MKETKALWQLNVMYCGSGLDPGLGGKYIKNVIEIVKLQHLKMFGRLDNDMGSTLNFLILVTVLWLCKVKSLFLWNAHCSI